jgi:GMP synthase (glutamine-hydrolysing)
MRKIMVFQHVAHEPLGTLDPMLKAAGFRIRYVNFGRHPHLKPSLEGYNGLIILGGPMGVYEAEAYPHLVTEMDLIREAVRRNIPVLGICLGAQLIAAALGGQVKKAERWEFGWHGVDISPEGRANPLFKEFKNSEKVFQIHQDTFDLPKEAVHLASSPICKNQAFCFGDKVYGYQFHLESDQAMILRWLHRPEQKKLIEELGGEVTYESLVADTEKYIQRSLELSQLSFGKFIEIFQLPERPIVLRSTR